MGPSQNRRSQNCETLCVCVNAHTWRDAARMGAVNTQTHGGKHLENTEDIVDRAWCCTRGRYAGTIITEYWFPTFSFFFIRFQQKT